MKRIFGLMAMGLGVALAGLGLLFLVGAGGHTSRYVVAAIGLGFGVALVGAGIALVRRGVAESPEQIMAEVLVLARERDGELSAADLSALLGRRARAGAGVMKDLVDDGVARRASDGGYVFEGLLPRLVVRRCAFCDFEGELNSNVMECPRCGGDMHQEREAKTVDEGLYSMDS